MKSSHAIFSIVTPSYNQGAFLAETIESVMGQEGDFFIDYIIIDGGSNDGSVDIIRRYCELLDHGKWRKSCLGITLRWRSERDRGQADALMKGFGMATGEILAWLNSDDSYLPGALLSAATYLNEHPETGLLYGGADYCDPAGDVIGCYRTDHFDLDTLASFNFICQPSAFFRRDVFEKVGGLDPKLTYAMDFDLWIRIGKEFPCRYLPKPLARYRLHEASKTMRSDTLQLNIAEGLGLAVTHFGWAPITRVYALCHCACRSRLPAFLLAFRPAPICLAVICALFRSLWLNRGLRRNDLKLINRANLRKLFKSRLDVMTGK